MRTHAFPGHFAARDAVVRSGALLLLAASLGTASSVASAQQVERGDTTVTAPEKPATDKPANGKSSNSRSGDDLQMRLEAAQKRLESAANEVAVLSAQVAGDVMESFASAFREGPRRAVIGVQLTAPESGNGAKVQNVSPGGPAEQAGIRSGDVIVAVNGKDVKGDVHEVVRMLRGVAPHSKVQVRVLRDGKPRTFDVEARPLDYGAYAWNTEPRDFTPSDPPEPPEPFAYSFGWNRDLRDMELTTLTPGLGRYFGTDKGVLVMRAPEDDVYKLQDGDVILSIDGREPASASHVARILRSYQPGEKLTLRLMRDRKPLNVEVTVPDDSRSRRTRVRMFERDNTTHL